MPDGSRCVSPQSPAFSDADPDAIAGGYDTQQELSASARNYIQNAGHTIDCKVDNENWFFGPQGGKPMRLCSIDGGDYIHAAALVNANPYNALVSSGNTGSVQTLVSQYGGSFDTQTNTASGTTSASDSSLPLGNEVENVVEEIQDVINGEWIDGVPNWAILAVAGVGLAFVVPKMVS